MSQFRPKVLSLYKTILREGYKWPKKDESEYIIEEAKYLFRQNKNIVNQDEIQEKIFEAESRLELARHYQIPYPRLFNAAPKSVEGDLKRVRSGYMSSYENFKENSTQSRKDKIDF